MRGGVGRPSLNQSSELAAPAGVAPTIARTMVRQIAERCDLPKHPEGVVEAGGDELQGMWFRGYELARIMYHWQMVRTVFQCRSCKYDRCLVLADLRSMVPQNSSAPASPIIVRRAVLTRPGAGA